MLEFYAAKGPRLFLDETSVFDIGSIIVGGADLSPKRAIPDDGDPRIDHSLEGFLFTCGPDHIRHPEPLPGGKGRYPLHGSFSASPAEVTAFEVGGLSAFASATVMTRLADGGLSKLDRRWHIDGVTGVVTLRDRVTNTGQSAFPAMMMYHMNIGGESLGDETRVRGAMIEAESLPWQFGDKDNFVFCVPAGGKDGFASLKLGPIPAAAGLTLNVDFETSTLPYLQMWRNIERPAYIIGIEPVSHDWTSRAELSERGALIPLEPGQSREYGLRFVFA